MTTEQFNAELAAISNTDLAEKVQDKISELCKTGARSFTMSVPPRIDDTDMLLCEMLRRFKKVYTPTPSIPPQSADVPASDQTDYVKCTCSNGLAASNCAKNCGHGQEPDQTDMVGAEAVLKEYVEEAEQGCKYEFVLKSNAITAMHRFASIQVEKVRKELEGENRLEKEFTDKVVKDLILYQSDLSAAQSRIAELKKEQLFFYKWTCRVPIEGRTTAQLWEDYQKARPYIIDELKTK